MWTKCYQMYFTVLNCVIGEEAVFYLFLRKQLNWDGGQYGSFATYKLFVGFMGKILETKLQ